MSNLLMLVHSYEWFFFILPTIDIIKAFVMIHLRFSLPLFLSACSTRTAVLLSSGRTVLISLSVSGTLDYAVQGKEGRIFVLVYYSRIYHIILCSVDNVRVEYQIKYHSRVR